MCLLFPQNGLRKTSQIPIQIEFRVFKIKYFLGHQIINVEIHAIFEKNVKLRIVRRPLKLVNLQIPSFNIPHKLLFFWTQNLDSRLFS